MPDSEGTQPQYRRPEGFEATQPRYQMQGGQTAEPEAIPLDDLDAEPLDIEEFAEAFDPDELIEADEAVAMPTPAAPVPAAPEGQPPPTSAAPPGAMPQTAPTPIAVPQPAQAPVPGQPAPLPSPGSWAQAGAAPVLAQPAAPQPAEARPQLRPGLPPGAVPPPARPGTIPPVERPMGTPLPGTMPQPQAGLPPAAVPPPFQPGTIPPVEQPMGTPLPASMPQPQAGLPPGAVPPPSRPGTMPPVEQPMGTPLPGAAPQPQAGLPPGAVPPAARPMPQPQAGLPPGAVPPPSSGAGPVSVGAQGSWGSVFPGQPAGPPAAPSPFGWAAGSTGRSPTLPPVESVLPRAPGAPPPAAPLPAPPGGLPVPGGAAPQSQGSPLAWSAGTGGATLLTRPPGEAPPAPTAQAAAPPGQAMPAGPPGALPPSLPLTLQPLDMPEPEPVASRPARPAEEDLEERWLYRQGGMVYGPFSGRDIARKIEAKELDESCQISEEDGPWRSLRDSPEFWPVVARAKAREQAEQARLAAERALKREALLHRVKIGGGVLGGVAALAALAAVGVSLLGDTDSGGAAGERSGVTAPIDPALAGGRSDIDGSPLPMPESTSNKAVAAPEKKPRTAAALTRKKKRPRRRRKAARAAAVKKAAAAKKTDTGAPRDTATESAVADFSSSGGTGGGGVPKAKINQIIQKKQRGLVRCIQAEVRRNDLFEGEFMVNFAILPSGSAGKVSLDNADDATPKMLYCMKAELGRWRFPSFRGASFQVSLPFNISR